MGIMIKTNIRVFPSGIIKYDYEPYNDAECSTVSGESIMSAVQETDAGKNKRPMIIIC